MPQPHLSVLTFVALIATYDLPPTHVPLPFAIVLCIDVIQHPCPQQFLLPHARLCAHSSAQEYKKALEGLGGEVGAGGTVPRISLLLEAPSPSPRKRGALLLS